MSNFINSLVMCLTIFPTWFAIVLLGFLTLVAIVVVIKVVGFVLDALPFV